MSLDEKFEYEFMVKRIGLKSRFILGVSGGPDSMWMLYLMKDLDIVVATVNYNKREDSWKDQQIVEDFCKQHNIKYEILSIDKDYKYEGNFQKIAREQRYDFYKKLYDKYKAKYLVLAHHKDDSIETYLFQKETKRKPRIFGISSLVNINGMKVFRPMVNLWFKDEIEKFCTQNNVPYAIDSSNEQPIYTRNKIRLKLKKMSLDQKNRIHKKIRIETQINLVKFSVAEELYEELEKKQFAYKWLKENFHFIHMCGPEVMFQFVHRNIPNAKISYAKLQSLHVFVLSQKNFKSFKISNNISLIKQDGILKIKET
ncbi:tRNA lysidine(34) synthetase TilS [Mycoplasma enhydrae]|uniref:tRNA lysidine(34) synthetase TilS n=1 Tax=Mycoplasma enhydrae TaxID=2499220 RepID=UPI0021E8D116|nr:tRNA lysidine(34) synthetase TilS [Mycoplasma enhydrae]MCV3733741.1 tRNA lysidine(34) synthetase TilS [Mycoplasma enhydrae]MCV3753603.1 tRNA lysidine(34) synthetase TilS [Mycoplasma enhydrae]